MKLEICGNNLVKTIQTDKNGEAQIYLEEGEYTVKEIKAPDGFEIQNEIQTIKIEKNEQLVELELENNAIKCGFLNLTKKSADDNEWNNIYKCLALEGAVYEIKNDNGELLYTVTTNQEGKIEEIKLKEGKYTIQEIQAPEYYILDETVYFFEIKENEQKVDFNLLNKSMPKPEKKLPRTGM